jgi:hypothetical protein
MAIEWTIEAGSAVTPSQLLRETTRLLDLVLGTAPDDMLTEGDGADSVTFDITARAMFADVIGTVEISSDWEVDDDGTPDPARIYAVVTAYRTQLSVAVAIAMAIAMTTLSGGEMSGVGLGRRYTAAEIGELVDELRRVAAPAPDDHAQLRGAVGRLAVRLGCANLPFA